MRHWVFTDEQLERALLAWERRLTRQTLAFNVPGEIVRNFLDSPEARVHKLMGGASYQPDRLP